MERSKQNVDKDLQNVENVESNSYMKNNLFFLQLFLIFGCILIELNPLKKMKDKNLRLTESSLEQIAIQKQRKKEETQRKLRSVGLLRGNQSQYGNFVPQTLPTSNFDSPLISHFTEGTVPLPTSDFVGQNNPSSYSDFVACGSPQPQKNDESEKYEKIIGYSFFGVMCLCGLFFIYAIFSK